MKEIPSKAGKKFNLIMDITLVFERYIYLHSGFYEVQVVHNQWANLKLSKSSMYFRPKMHDFGFYMTNVQFWSKDKYLLKDFVPKMSWFSHFIISKLQKT